MTNTEPPVATATVNPRRLYAAGAIGTTLEWFDFMIFGLMAALVFDELFFPALDPAVGKIAAFATFAAGFLARPLGGIIFSHVGDRLGRRQALVASMLLMGLATVAMGLLPTYASIGIAAPLLLTLLRFLQGLALGGEWGSAAALLVEHASEGRRGFFSFWVQLGGIIGPLLATVTVLVLSFSLSDPQFTSWGWRLPFLFSAVLVVVGFWLRRALPEAPEFERLKKEGRRERFPVLAALRSNRRSLVLVFFMHLGSTTISFTVQIFTLSYAAGELGYSRTVVLGISALVNLLIIYPAMHSTTIADRIGRRPIFLIGSVGLIVIAFPYFWLVNSGSVPLLALAIVLGSASNLAMYMTGGAFFLELFPVATRASGASLSVQLATVVGGGTAPMIAASLMAWSGGQTWPISAYLAAAGALATIATLTAPETSGRSLNPPAVQPIPTPTSSSN